ALHPPLPVPRRHRGEVEVVAAVAGEVVEEVPVGPPVPGLEGEDVHGAGVACGRAVSRAPPARGRAPRPPPPWPGGRWRRSGPGGARGAWRRGPPRPR